MLEIQCILKMQIEKLNELFSERQEILTDVIGAKEYWSKARLFIDFALDDISHPAFALRGMFATQAMELLAKSTLAFYSPLLIADVNDSGKNLLKAAGVGSSGSYVTIPAKTLWERCNAIFASFNVKEATNMSRNRNEFLHGAGNGFDSIPENVWWARYWHQMSILLTAQNKVFEDFVHDSHIAVIAESLRFNSQQKADKLATLIQHAKITYGRRKSGQWTMAEEKDWGLFSQSLYCAYRTVDICPACKSFAQLGGDGIESTEVGWNEEEFDQTVTHSVFADYFVCDECHLELDDYELIEASGLPTSFSVEGDIDDIDFLPEYGND